MVQLSFTKDFENCSQLSDEQILTVALAITDKAIAHSNIQEFLKKRGKCLEKAFIVFCDIDRIYMTLDPDASPEQGEDFIIRTWDYHISEDNQRALSIEWSFHCMGEACSEEHCSGYDDIVIFS